MNFSRIFIFLGFLFLLIGALVWLMAKWGISFGKLPGDVCLKGEKCFFHFPIISSILLSIILTILINLFLWLFRK